MDSHLNSASFDVCTQSMTLSTGSWVYEASLSLRNEQLASQSRSKSNVACGDELSTPNILDRLNLFADFALLCGCDMGVGTP